MIIKILVFIFGLVIGSFLNCVIYRQNLAYRQAGKKSFLRGRSLCPKCGKQLKWYDLIPVISYFILAGKCRDCRKKISIQYPLVELATAILFVSLANFDHVIQTFYFFIIASLLIIIFVYDLRNYIIPDKVVLPAIGLALAYNLFSVLIGDFTWAVFWGRFLAGFWAGLGFFALFLISKGKWMGFGDVKLAVLMGFLLGPVRIVAALYIAFLFGGAIGLVLIILRKKTMKSELPFGPFLVAGTFLAMIFSKTLLGWYYNLL